jgi:hypothetical protein
MTATRPPTTRSSPTCCPKRSGRWRRPRRAS